MNEHKILITGATGNFGRTAIASLLKKGTGAQSIYALVRDESKAEELKALGVNIVRGDYDDYDSLIAAFTGKDKLLFISASDVLRRVEQHENVVKAARETGVKHVVYTSFLRRNETENSPIAMVAEAHLKTEQWLKESGLAYTLLKDNLYMDFVPFFIGDRILETGTIYLPAGEGKAGFALRAEMAEAAAEVLVSPGHEHKAYDLTNTTTYSYHDVARYITGITGKHITYVSPSAEEYVRTLAEAGVPAEFIGIFSGFAVAQAEGELDFAGNDLAQLLGREPLSLEAFLQSVYGKENS